MSIIDTTYFKGRIYLADIGSGNSVVVGNTVSTNFIPLYETEYLKKALGYPLWKAFTEGLDVNPIAAKWTDLRDGKEYTVGNDTYYWNGFKNAEKVSPISYYVYCEYLTAQAVNVTGTGTTVNEKQNATSVSPAQNIARAYTDMNELNKTLWHFLDNNRDTYTEYNSRFVECFGSRNTIGI